MKTWTISMSQNSGDINTSLLFMACTVHKNGEYFVQGGKIHWVAEL